ncbi:prosaposin-like isoform X1 [Tachysurus fulvidraco]|uniref:prosaposin-like isoform X1 n=1 Tax=Tachysurus fulvidraco TaxID=1234273 RepID=UPI000F4D95B8|nr:prosaposin-like isoform X1 [Tachysurus fulvidraco]
MNKNRLNLLRDRKKMSTVFQLGVLLLFVGAVQCEDRPFGIRGLEVKSYERNLQKADKAQIVCHVCTKIVNKVFKLIGNQLSKNNIRAALNKVCDKLKFKRSCKSLVHKYREKLVRIIMSAKNPRLVCKLLHLCIIYEN